MPESHSITDFQIEVARAFFSLPEAETFLLAGGLALLAQGMSSRPTADLDAFTCEADAVLPASRAFTSLAHTRAWQVQELHSTRTFVRLKVFGTSQLVVDLALDAPPGQTPMMTFIGPTFAPDDLAARKLLALFDRAMPRDFVDVYVLARTRTLAELVAGARQLDPGVDDANLLVALRQIARYRDEGLPAPQEEVPGIRAFFRAWEQSLADTAGQTDESAKP